MRPRPADPVACLLGLTGLAAALLPFLQQAPNRLLSGSAVMLWTLSPQVVAILPALLWLAIAGVSAWPATRARLWLTALLACALVILLPIGAGVAASALATEAASARVRIQLGAGFWLMLLCAGLLLGDRLRAPALPRPAAWIMGLGPLALLAWLANRGMLDALAPMREYVLQRTPFHAALLRHGALVAGALALAVPLGLPLGLVAYHRGRTGRAVLGVLNVLQTVPSLALFALLIAPLAWLATQVPGLATLGIGGTGAAPAVIALTLYALLPIVRSVVAGLDSVPAAVLDAARGMGMRPAQQLWRVRVPLAWPVLLAGLRVVTVQSVGLAAVAALIGAGGLGHFVFLGLGQGANDLVLLGTLAIIALALAADAAFQLLQRLTERPA